MAAVPGGSGSATPAPNPANIVYRTYTASGIIFAKANEANLATAKLLDAAEDSLTDVFSPVTLATGKITSAATDSPTVQGTDTDFVNDFSVGDYLFYYTANASPILLGKVFRIDSGTTITLTGNASAAITSTPGAYCGKTNTVIGVGEQILMRIPVVPFATGQIIMPNWNAYRIQSGVPTSYNLESRSSLTTYSAINNPTTPGSNVNTPYTITPIWDYTKVTNANTFQYVFLSTASFPNYVYAVLNPFGNSAVDNLASNTLYRLFASQEFANNGILVTSPYPVLFLQTAGY